MKASINQAMTLKHLLMVGLTLMLCACGSTKPGPPPALTPFPAAKNDLPDSKIIPAVDAFVKAQSGPPNTRFDYTRVDLNNDGLRDALILFKSPHNYWCSWSGCMMLVLKSGKKDFHPASDITAVRGPIIISETRTNGWKDIILRTSDGHKPARTVILKHDGRAYPGNPATAQTVLGDFGSLPGTRAFP